MTKRLKLDYVNLKEIKKWPGNAREWDLGAIHESMNAFGFRDPLAVNQNNNQIEEGHGRINVLLQKQSAGEQPPNGIVVQKGEWFVPVLWFDDDPDTQKRYALAHNRTQDLSSYNMDKLASELTKLLDKDLLEGTGYTEDDLDDIKQLVESSAEDFAKQELKKTIKCPECGFEWSE